MSGLDTGDMCLLERLPITAADTTASLHDKLADLGGRMIVQALEMSAGTGLPRTPQPAEGVTYAHKVEKAESWMDWCLSAEQLDRRLRAFNPFPGGRHAAGRRSHQAVDGSAPGVHRPPSPARCWPQMPRACWWRVARGRCA